MPTDSFQTTYATPEEVAQTMGLPTEFGGDTYGFWTPSDTTVPSYDHVCMMIRSNEDVIDRRLRRAWREHQVKDKVCNINNYWHDQNAWRSEYYMRGGNYVQLHKDIREWDPQKGDRLYIRQRGNSWRDVTFAPNDQYRSEADADPRAKVSFWFDYDMGRLFLRMGPFQMTANSLKITYRYGSEEEPPASIRRLCCLMTASQIINMSVFAIKVGNGGDIAGVRQDLQKMWQDEMNQIWSSWQRIGSVHSLLE